MPIEERNQLFEQHNPPELINRSSLLDNPECFIPGTTNSDSMEDDSQGDQCVNNGFGFISDPTYSPPGDGSQFSPYDAQYDLL